jgi:hypothetical protein
MIFSNVQTGEFSEYQVHEEARFHIPTGSLMKMVSLGLRGLKKKRKEREGWALNQWPWNNKHT